MDDELRRQVGDVQYQLNRVESKLAEALHILKSRKCAACGGSGHEQIAGMYWARCSACDGKGY